MAEAAPDCLIACALALVAYFNTENYRIGMDAFAKKKKPKFVGR